MNWIERLYEIKGCDQYSQNCEGYYLEYIFNALLPKVNNDALRIVDIGGGDGFYLSNSRHLHNLGWDTIVLDLENGVRVTTDNALSLMPNNGINVISIDIDGNDYWILDTLLKVREPDVVVAEFNPAFLDARAIKYNPNHSWDGTDYYGFSFEAGRKLADTHGYRVIFQLADMNLFMVRADLIEGLHVPEVRYTPTYFFKHAERELEWVIL